jgi:hypothetical protein
MGYFMFDESALAREEAGIFATNAAYAPDP